MPKIDKVLTLEISPEQFLNSCSATELQEIDLLIQSPRFQYKMKARSDQRESLGTQSATTDGTVYIYPSEAEKLSHFYNAFGMDQKPQHHCQDCNKDTHVDSKDFYMVKDRLWKAHGVGLGMLCMKCFEDRLGRKLQAEDLSRCNLNLYGNPYTMQLLASPLPNPPLKE